MESRGKTLFIDIDGTIFRHQVDGSGANFTPSRANEFILEGVKFYFNEWHSKGYRIILTTGRTESMRKITEQQLVEAGLFWDMLLMGIGGGERILINDIPPGKSIKAVAINVKRDEGFDNIDELYHEAKVALGCKEENNKYVI